MKSNGCNLDKIVKSYEPYKQHLPPQIGKRINRKKGPKTPFKVTNLNQPITLWDHISAFIKS